MSQRVYVRIQRIGRCAGRRQCTEVKITCGVIAAFRIHHPKVKSSLPTKGARDGLPLLPMKLEHLLGIKLHVTSKPGDKGGFDAPFRIVAKHSSRRGPRLRCREVERCRVQGAVKSRSI